MSAGQLSMYFLGARTGIYHAGAGGSKFLLSDALEC